MSQVYTFCKTGSSKSTSTPTPTRTGTGVQTPQGYSFKKDDEQTPVTFNENDFPSLGSTKPPAPKNIGSWGNASMNSVIREPFPVQVAVPRRDIPPLVFKVKKNKKAVYEDDEDELCNDYDVDSDSDYETKDPRDVNNKPGDYYEDEY
jgi:hypothetical protein